MICWQEGNVKICFYPLRQKGIIQASISLCDVRALFRARGVYDWSALYLKTPTVWLVWLEDGNLMSCYRVTWNLLTEDLFGCLGRTRGFCSVSSGSSRRKTVVVSCEDYGVVIWHRVLRVTQVKWRWRGWLMKFVAWFVFLNISVDSPKCCDLEQSKHTRPMDFVITTQS